MTRKIVAILLSILLLISMISLILIGNLNVVKADDQGTRSTGGNVGSVPGITVLNITSTQTFVEEGFSADITATVDNTGSSASIFYVTFLDNGVPLDTQPVTLGGESSTALSYVWNTTGFALGNFTLSAYAWSNPAETSLVSANSVNTNILVTCPDDLTGQSTVNFLDITAFVAAYINYYQTGQCNPATDFNHDGRVDFSDLVLFVANYQAYFVGPTPFVTNGGLTLTLAIKQTTYSLGEPVNFTLSINNVSKSTITFTRTASTFDYMVYNSTGIVYRYSIGIAFPMWAQIYTLAPGESLTENFSWDQVCNLFFSPAAGSLGPSNPVAFPPVFPASPGTYYILGEALGMQTIPQQITIT